MGEFDKLDFKNNVARQLRAAQEGETIMLFCSAPEAQSYAGRAGGELRTTVVRMVPPHGVEMRFALLVTVIKALDPKKEGDGSRGPNKQSEKWIKETDWELHDQEIAREMGVNVQTVRHARSKFGYDSSRSQEDSRHLKYMDADWSKDNALLSEELGATVTLIREKRKIYGAGVKITKRRDKRSK